MRERIDRKHSTLQKALSEQAFDVPIGAGLAVIPRPRLLVQGEPRTMPLARKHKLRLLRLRQGADPSRKSGGALHRLHCFCLEFDGACEVQRRVPTDWIIEPVDVSGYGSFSLAS